MMHSRANLPDVAGRLSSKRIRPSWWDRCIDNEGSLVPHWPGRLLTMFGGRILSADANSILVCAAAVA